MVICCFILLMIFFWISLNTNLSFSTVLILDPIMLRRERRRQTVEDCWRNIVIAITGLLQVGELFDMMYQLIYDINGVPSVYCRTCRCHSKNITVASVKQHHISRMHQQRRNGEGNDSLEGQLRTWNRLYDGLDEAMQAQYSFEVFGRRAMIKCNCCYTRIQTINAYDLHRHHTTPKHQEAFLFKQRNPEPDQESWESCSSRQNACWLEICIAFLRSEIPCAKLMNEKLVACFEKWMRMPMPDQSTLRQGYISIVNCETIKMIRQTIGNNNIQIFVDETIDSLGRKIAVLLVARLMRDGPGKPMAIFMD